MRKLIKPAPPFRVTPSGVKSFDDNVFAELRLNSAFRFDSSPMFTRSAADALDLLAAKLRRAERAATVDRLNLQVVGDNFNSKNAPLRLPDFPPNPSEFIGDGDDFDYRVEPYRSLLQNAQMILTARRLIAEVQKRYLKRSSKSKSKMLTGSR